MERGSGALERCAPQGRGSGSEVVEQLELDAPRGRHQGADPAEIDRIDVHVSDIKHRIIEEIGGGDAELDAVLLINLEGFLSGKIEIEPGGAGEVAALERADGAGLRAGSRAGARERRAGDGGEFPM